MPVYAVTNWDNPEKVLEAQEMVNEKLSMPGKGIAGMYMMIKFKQEDLKFNNFLSEHGLK